MVLSATSVRRGVNILGGLRAVPGPGPADALAGLDETLRQREKDKLAAAQIRQNMAIQAERLRMAKAAARGRGKASTPPPPLGAMPDVIGLNTAPAAAPAAGPAPLGFSPVGFALGTPVTGAPPPLPAFPVGTPVGAPAVAPAASAPVSTFPARPGLPTAPPAPAAPTAPAPGLSTHLSQADAMATRAGLAASRAGFTAMPEPVAGGGATVPVAAPGLSGLIAQYDPATGAVTLPSEFQNAKPAQRRKLESQVRAIYAQQLNASIPGLQHAAELAQQRYDAGDAGALADTVKAERLLNNALTEFTVATKDTTRPKAPAPRGVFALEGPELGAKSPPAATAAGPKAGVRGKTDASPVDTVVAAPPESGRVVTPSKVLIRDMPRLNGELVNAITQRQRLTAAYNQSVASGDTKRAQQYATTIQKLDATLTYLEGMQAVNDLALGSATRLGRVLTHYYGSEVTPVLRGDGTYDLYVNGALGPRDMQKLSKDALANMAREFFDSAYRDQVAEVATANSKAQGKEAARAAADLGLSGGLQVLQKYAAGDLGDFGISGPAVLVYNSVTGNNELHYWEAIPDAAPGLPTARRRVQILRPGAAP